MEQLEAAFKKEGSELPDGLRELFNVEGTGARAGRLIFHHIYDVWYLSRAKDFPNAIRKPTVVWPPEVKEAVRQTVGTIEDPEVDSQFDQDETVHHVTMKEMTEIDWTKRPPEFWQPFD